MEFLTRRIGPFPLWLYGGIAIVGGVILYYYFFKRNGSSSNANSTSGVAGANQNYNPLNPTNDPNIDPNTGVPYQLEEAINPNTNMPYYYSSAGAPGTANAPGNPTPTPSNTNTAPTAPTTTPTKPVTPTTPPVVIPPVAAPKPAPATTVVSNIGGQPVAANAISYASNVNQQFSQPGEVVQSGGKGYTFEPTAGTGQTNHLWNVAIQEYGVSGTSAINSATQAIINANPNLAGKSYTYQPPAGTRIIIPQL